MSVHSCVHPLCKATDASLHLPSDEMSIKIWRKHLGIPPKDFSNLPPSSRVCWRHFPETAISLQIGHSGKVKWKVIQPSLFVPTVPLAEVKKRIPPSPIPSPYRVRIQEEILRKQNLIDRRTARESFVHCARQLKLVQREQQKQESEKRVSRRRQDRASRKRQAMIKRIIDRSQKMRRKALEDEVKFLRQKMRSMRRSASLKSAKQLEGADPDITKFPKGFDGLAFRRIDHIPLSYSIVRQANSQSVFALLTPFGDREGFEAFFDLLLDKNGELFFELGSRRKPSRLLPGKDGLLLFFCRAFAGMQNQMVALFFGVSSSTSSRTFLEWTQFLYAFLQAMNPPVQNSRILELNDRIRSTLADPTVTDIIDSSGIELQKPSGLAAQSVTWSDYYSTNCAKFLISIAPCGYLRYVSGAHPGRITDATLCETGFYLMLEEREDPSSILADRGFFISFQISQRKCTINVPPKSPADKMPFTEDEVGITKKIAKDRIFSEHAVKYVKSWKFLQGAVPIACVDLIEPILFIAAMFANFTCPLMVHVEAKKVYPEHPCAHEIVFNTELSWTKIDK